MNKRVTGEKRYWAGQSIREEKCCRPWYLNTSASVFNVNTPCGTSPCCYKIRRKCGSAQDAEVNTPAIWNTRGACRAPALWKYFITIYGLEQQAIPALHSQLCCTISALGVFC